MLTREDFSDAARSDFYVGREREAEASIRGGQYRVTVTEEDWQQSYSVSIDEVVEALRVDATAASAAEDAGGGGVVCYAHESAARDVGYQLTITPAERAAHIDRVFERDFEELASDTGIDAIRTVGAVNRLRADCIGATAEHPAVLVLRVNGHEVLRAEDDRGFPLFDGVGVTAYSERERAEVVFDDLVASELR